MSASAKQSTMKKLLLISGNVIIIGAMIITLVIYVEMTRKAASESALDTIQVSIENLASTSKVYFTTQKVTGR